ncbi:QacE family quaternary ammonium compound efflux SMR transporter [Methylobacterium haplocladii]|uniref:Guanidinium exporter n=2 Tax=Methylobacterium haplocladii TaxID=1176176 RepID=A0A512IJR2_9HYPH|nr:QacE family quaternary ammonium compound efflux SMR transporter [Methylobacterium haplocladii]GLS61014.1 QacE family quaternary ammonium compound efflux SMR transporter [Methylobacterium haplocladii]
MRSGTNRIADPCHLLRSPSGILPPGKETRMAWAILFIAGLFEIGWAIGLKYADGFTRLWPSVWTLVSMVISVVLLSFAVRTLPIGTGYAVWTGIGTVGTAILGIVLFSEPVTAARIGCITLVVAGILGLKLAE